MTFRLATMKDLHQLKDVYKQIIKNMNENDIQIWDDIYPCDFFEQDIRNKQLYVLMQDEILLSAFVLCSTNAGAAKVKWEDCKAKSLYIDRLGVNVNHSKKGVGSLMISKAKEIAKKAGNEYLRLFVVDVNEPAIKLYIKNGFKKATGVYDEVFDDGFILHEYGYEIKL